TTMPCITEGPANRRRVPAFINRYSGRRITAKAASSSRRLVMVLTKCAHKSSALHLHAARNGLRQEKSRYRYRRKWRLNNCGGLMKRFITTAATLAALFLISTPLTAQPWWSKLPNTPLPRTADGKVNMSAPAPRLPDGKPDFSGVWNPPLGYLRDLSKDLKEPVPFQPWAKTLYDERSAGLHWREEPDANCLPQGVPKVLLAPAPWRMVQTPERVFFIHEAFNLWWQCFTDAPEFVPTADITPTWHGYSTAKYEGDT